MSESRKRLAAFVARADSGVPSPIPDGPTVTLVFDRIAGEDDLTLGDLRVLKAEADAADACLDSMVADRTRLWSALFLMVRDWKEIVGDSDHNKTPNDVLEKAEAALALSNGQHTRWLDEILEEARSEGEDRAIAAIKGPGR